MLWNRILPAEAVSGALRVVLTGRSQALVEQHRGVIGYTQNEVTVRLENGFLRIGGQGLELAEYSPQDLCVTGRIDALEFRP